MALLQLFSGQDSFAKFTLHLCLLTVQLHVCLHRNRVGFQAPVALRAGSVPAGTLFVSFNLTERDNLEAVWIADASDLC